MNSRQLKAAMILACFPSALALSSGAAGAQIRGDAVFTPAHIPDLQAWFDPSQAAGVTQTAGKLDALDDLSGKGNSVYQKTAAYQPAFTGSGINGLGSATFAGAAYLLGSNVNFSTDLFNQSTVFVVSNQTPASGASSVLFSGRYDADPHFGLKLSEGGASRYDLGSTANGRLSAVDVASGPALWTAAGSVTTHVQQLRKNGNLLQSDAGPKAAVSGAFPLAIGATAQGGRASYFYHGQIGETLVYDRVLSASEMTEVEGYLACKWGLQNRLPANHPYRTVCPQGGSHPSLPLPAQAAGALPDPQQLRSSGGQLTFSVTVKQAADGYPQYIYNGSAVPPTLRLLPGDTLHVDLTNALPKPPPGAAYLNDTNLHYHGLHVSPNAPGDDSIDLLAMPGQTLHYTIAIPASHPTGLYWYHSHAHGEAERQNLAGLSGALVIDGIARYAPQVASYPERILIARDTLPAGQILPAADGKQVAAMLWAMRHAYASLGGLVRGPTTASTRNPYVDVNANYHRFERPAASSHCLAGSPEAPSRNWTLNGMTQPSIGIRPGEKQFWRLVNAGSDTYLDVSVDNAPMQIVALDGVPLALAGSALPTVAHYLVPPASRLEFIVTGPAAGTAAYLRTSCFDAGAGGLAMPAATLAKLDPTHSLSDQSRRRGGDRLAAHPAAAARFHGAAYMRNFITKYAIARSQTLTYSSQDQINGQSYDPAGPPQFYAQSGTMERWQIVNVSNQVHTFHIHQTHFLVESIVGGTPIEASNVGRELDNINVPAATANGPGSVTLVMDFTDPSIIGTFLLHCHILSHEDAGMMAKIRVGKTPPLQTTAPAQGLTFASPSAAAQTFAVSGGAAPLSVSGCGNVANASVAAATVRVAPAGAGGCVLVVADASGLTASVAVTVVATASRITVAPGTLAFSGPDANPENATVAGGSLPYSVSGCANVAAATVSGSTLTVKPESAGSCSLTVADTAGDVRSVPVSVNGAAAGSASDTTTFHNNNARQGWNSAETVLTAKNVNANTFGKVAFLSASGYGKVYAQPLLAANEAVNGAKHNLLLIATATDQVYAYDDKTLAVVWHRSFTNPGAGVTQQRWSDIDCTDVNPDIGIVGTPVVDRQLDRLFVVVPTKESGAYHMRLHAISLQNGNDAVSPVEVSASVMLAGNTGIATTSAEHNFNRAALLEADGSVYVSLGSHCDAAANTTHGWVLAYAAASLAPAGTVLDSTNAQGSAYLGVPWMSGFGPAADAAGNVYFSTGNGPWNGVTDFSMSDIKVPGNLDIGNGSSFTPIDEARQSEGDGDLGSGGVMLLPDGLSAKYPHLLVQGGKSGTKYLLNTDHLGGQQQKDAGAVWQAGIGGGFGGPAYFRDAAGKSYIVYGSGSPLATYVFDGTSSFSRASAVNVPGNCLECRNGGSQPVVSSNGTNAGSAIVWALQTPGSGGGAVSLFAFNATTMSLLYASAAGTWQPGSGAGVVGGALISPLVADGRVYVPTDGGVAVFGLK